MKSVYLLLGSNENNRIANLQRARFMIGVEAGKICKVSALYETEAWGLKEQNAFLNQAIEIETLLTPVQLLGVLKSIEKKIGRVETIKWGPRIIDIDILFYGNGVIETEELKVPHPFLHERRFTLAPLNEIAPDFVHPILQKAIRLLLQECSDESAVTISNGD